jgi:nucleotide-binding universal stress UspA family protein
MAIETILVAVGPHEDNRAELLGRAAVDVAGPADATVVLGHVFTEDEYAETMETLDFDRLGGDVSPADVAQRLTAVRDMEDMFNDAGVDYEVRGEIDDRAGAIVTLADRVGADRIFVGGKRRSPTGKAVFGSDSQEVMLTASCPVTYVREDMDV